MRRWPLAQAEWQDCFRLPVINNNVHRVYSRRKHVWHCLCMCVLLKQSLVRGHKSLLKQKTPREDGDVLLWHVLVVRLIYFDELQSSKTKVCLLRNEQERIVYGTNGQSPSCFILSVSSCHSDRREGREKEKRRERISRLLFLFLLPFLLLPIRWSSSFCSPSI